VLSEGGAANYGRVVAKIAQSIFVISRVTGPQFTKFLHDVVALSPLLMQIKE